MVPPLLILDLDETLVCATEHPLPHGAGFAVGQYFVYVRPHFQEFLESASKWFKLAVWTSAGSDYGQAVIQRLISPPARLEFAWFSDKCVQRTDLETQLRYAVKDLRKVRRTVDVPLERILVIDDSPEKLAQLRQSPSGKTFSRRPIRH
jgi:TFIIF-interacting CTD phosphatase-like protein